MPISKIKQSGLDASALTGSNISDGTIDTADLAVGAVTSAKLDTNIAVSGDLTVDTNTLYVDSTNNRVGVGTISPTRNLVVSDSSQANIALQTSASGSTLTDGFQIQADSSNAYVWNYENTNILFGTNNTTRMTVDANGYVTKPNQVSFWTWLNANQTGYDGFTASSWGTQYVKFNYEEYDIGGGYQSNGADLGKFIAPVAGTYWFGTAVYGLNFSSGGWGQAWFNVNGARKTGTDIVMSNATGGFIYYTNIIKLAVNDAVTVHPYSSAGNTNVTIQANANHTWFKGYLLG